MKFSSWLSAAPLGQAIHHLMARPGPSPSDDEECIKGGRDEFRSSYSSLETIVVDWNGPEDPENPRNWPSMYKAWVTLLISIYSFIVYSGSSIIVPSYEGMEAQFGLSREVVSLVLALYVVGYGTGPLLFSPVSEVASIGRNPPYIISFLLFVVISIVLAALDNFPAIVVLRFLQGFFGSPCLATGGATIHDMYNWTNTPYAFVVWVSCIYCGPAFGPIIASRLVEERSWHWSLWEIAMMAGPLLLLMICTMPETSPVTILLNRARRLRRENPQQAETILAPSELSPSTNLKTHINNTLSRPLEISIKDPAIGFVCLYCSFLYAIYYSFFEVFHLVYIDIYQMSPFSFSLVFLSVVVGCFIAASVYTLYLRSRPPFEHLITTNTVEESLLPSLPAVFFITIGLFLFAWSARASVHWIVPTVGIAIYAGSTFVTFQGILIYIPPSYPQYVASMLAANDFMRSVTAAIFIMVTPYMYQNLGVSKGVTILASVSVLGIVGMFILWWLGARLRAKSRFAA